MGKGLGWLFLVVKAVCAATIFASALYTVWAVGPALETRFNPVVSKLLIQEITYDGKGSSVIRAAFEKRRECEYIGISWFKGSREEGFERVPIILMREPGDTSSPNRPVGYQKAGPWIIQGLTPEEVRQGSFAELSHRCHPFWMTTTWFYP